MLAPDSVIVLDGPLYKRLVRYEFVPVQGIYRVVSLQVGEPTFHN